ncbi:secreted RxLR effector protein 161-like [Amaranthus tricolor]|uniref:secreted RxLR effector protein 161-like n=1 Tax=Amaranthus tricolor TaxID=29722 RepID=UPI00258E8901|nr:secreted RxLR effector protein 161-like [Amaranthus tricolor]
MVRIPCTSVGCSVMYTMVCSRPDIAYAVSLDSSKLTGLCDSDYGGDLHAIKSTSVFVFIVGCSTVSLQSSLQDGVALSTTKEECITVTESFNEAKWLKGVVVEVEIVEVNGDLSAPIDLCIHVWNPMDDLIWFTETVIVHQGSSNLFDLGDIRG